MKTCLFTTSWLDGDDPQGSPRMGRTLRYVHYYARLRHNLGFEKLFLSDNFSDRKNIARLSGLNSLPITIIPHYKTLTRGEGPNNYPYAWRGIYDLEVCMAAGFQKIIVCDTDAFILSKKMVNYVRELKSGYTTFWSPTYKFPLCEISVICEDAFPALRTFFKSPWQNRHHSRALFETALPFTLINKDFVGDRYGEFNCDIEQRPGMDFYTQARIETPLAYEGWL